MTRVLLVFFVWALVGCQTEEYPLPIAGSTYRIDKDVPAKGSEIRIDILTGWSECVNAKIEELDLCLPQVDRAAGETRLAFDLRDPVGGRPLLRSIDREQLTVTHDSKLIEDFEVIPHDPQTGRQLFILLVDGSGSMYDNDGERAKKVYEALLNKSVVNGFFPSDGSKTGVVLLRFMGPEVHGLDGAPPRVIDNAAEYRKVIRQHLLQPTGGYTYLYKAIRYAMTELPAIKGISDFMALGNEPTLIVLTDGFNNEAASDVCADNVSRLNETLEVIREVRAGQGPSAQMSVYSVGLGTRLPRKRQPPSKNRFKKNITSVELCGKYGDQRIDGHLEDYGIDDVSLEWIAEAGGGSSFVRKEPNGLAEVFQKAAAVRYRWYELRYRVPHSFFHRMSYEVRLSLSSFARAQTTVEIHPSAWMDAPGGVMVGGDGWTTKTPFRSTFALFMPILGLLVVLTFLGPAWFNARRAIFRRARNRKK